MRVEASKKSPWRPRIPSPSRASRFRFFSAGANGTSRPRRFLSRHVVAQCGTSWYAQSVSDHYTLRLPPGTRARLTQYARRTGLPERALAQRYLEEGLRHDAHPLIQFLDGPSGRRASMVGSGLDVWEVIATVRDNDGSAGEAAAYLEVPLGLVQAAVAYYGEYRDEIDQEIELNESEYHRGLEAAAAGERAIRE